MFGTKKIKINVTSTEVIGSVGVEDLIKVHITNQKGKEEEEIAGPDGTHRTTKEGN